MLVFAPCRAADPGELKWSFKADSGEKSGIHSSPAVGPDGNIYFGSLSNYIYALDPDGNKKWRFNTKGAVVSAPTIGPEGTIYAGSNDNFVYALNPDGSKQWSYETMCKVWSSPAIGVDGTVYAGSMDGYLYAINPDGSPKWMFDLEGLHIQCSPVIGQDGTIYIGNDEHMLYAVNPDGTKKWSFKAIRNVFNAPAIGFDGTIYIGAGHLYALTPQGSVKWSFEPEKDYITSSPCIGMDGTVYVGSCLDCCLYAVDPLGNKKWRFKTKGKIDYSSPVVGHDGTIYFGSWDSYLYALGPEGNLKWRFKTGDNVSSSPAITEDGTIYVGSYDNRLYAIYTQSKGPAKSAWPMVQGNLRRLGRARQTDAPDLDVQAMGSSAPLTTSVAGQASVSLSLNSKNRANQVADWWIIAYSPVAGFHSLVLEPELDWQEQINCLTQAELIDFSSLPIPEPPLFIGKNYIFFALDDNADHELDLTWWDFVQVNVR